VMPNFEIAEVLATSSPPVAEIAIAEPVRQRGIGDETDDAPLRLAFGARAPSPLRR